MQEILLEIRYFQRGLSKSLKKVNFIFLSNPVPFNTLTANYEYCCSDRENLLPPIQLQLSEQLKTFSQFSIAFLESTLNLNILKKKMSLIAQVFMKLLTPKDVHT